MECSFLFAPESLVFQHKQTKFQERATACDAELSARIAERNGGDGSIDEQAGACQGHAPHPKRTTQRQRQRNVFPGTHPRIDLARDGGEGSSLLPTAVDRSPCLPVDVAGDADYFDG